MAVAQTRNRRRGLSLVELLIASAVMAMIVAALATLSRAVQIGSEHGQGQSEAVQHARVTLERITRLADEATASDDFPGMLVLEKEIGGNQYPDTLVIWHPTTTAVDAKGLPRFNELVIFTTRDGNPNELIELTAPSDTRTVPDYTDSAEWQAEIDTLKESDASRQITLTNLVRTASTDGTTSPSSLRGCVRFNVQLTPSESDLANFVSNSVPWKELPWVQNIYSTKIGLRNVWLRIELQLMPGRQSLSGNTSSQKAIPFFDSAAIHYPLEKP